MEETTVWEGLMKGWLRVYSTLIYKDKDKDKDKAIYNANKILKLNFILFL